MTQDELVAAISADAKLTAAAAKQALASFCTHVVAALGAGEEVRLPGFGRFEPHVLPPTTGHDPRTGAPIEIRARARIRFVMSAQLKRRVTPLAEAWPARAPA